MSKKPKAPKTNAEGLALVLSKMKPAHLAKRLNITRAAVCKWKAVPQDRVNAVAEIVEIPRELILPEVYGPA